MISHALTIRELRRRELLEEAAREQLVGLHFPTDPFAMNRLHDRLGQVLRRLLTDARFSRVALRVATQG